MTKKGKEARTERQGSSVVSDQSSRAEEDHEDDEGLEPAVLHDLEAGLPQLPVDLPESGRGVDVAAVKAAGAN